MSKKNFGVLAAMSAGAALLVGCDRQKPSVVQYDIPKSPRAEGVAEATPAGMPAGTPNAGASMSNTAVPVARGDAEWTVPPAWKAEPASLMRKGGWKSGEALITVTAFPGDLKRLGGMQANVARWAGQLGMPAPATDAELQKLLETGKVAGVDATRVALANDGKTLTTVILERGDAVWFFKISGPAAAVEAADASFNAFLTSVKFSAAK